MKRDPFEVVKAVTGTLVLDHLHPSRKTPRGPVLVLAMDLDVLVEVVRTAETLLTDFARKRLHTRV